MHHFLSLICNFWNMMKTSLKHKNLVMWLPVLMSMLTNHYLRTWKIWALMQTLILRKSSYLASISDWRNCSGLSTCPHGFVDLTSVLRVADQGSSVRDSQHKALLA
eukprot:scpid79559/ scgid18350/ 